MPLQPNFLERLLIKEGEIPWPLLDAGIPIFMMTALVGAGKIGLFQTMREGSATASTLASKTDTDERALQNLLRVLEPLGYVKEGNGEYSLTNTAKKTVPIELFPDICHFISEQMKKNIEGIERALREAPEEGVVGWETVKEGAVAQSYQVTMRWLASGTVGEVTSKVKLPSGSRKMLDIGGSHGLYCVEMCRKYPELQATVMDWSVGIENANKTLEEETDVADRIDTLEADFFEDPFPKGYDYAFFGNIIHGNAPEQNRKLFNRLGDAMNEQATIGILDQFDNLSGSQFNRSVAALVGWNLFLFSNGRAYDIDEVKSWLNEAGFPNISVKPLSKSPGFTLILAKSD